MVSRYDKKGVQDGKLDLDEFRRFILDITIGQDVDHPDRAFNRVIVKFTELIENTRS